VSRVCLPGACVQVLTELRKYGGFLCKTAVASGHEGMSALVEANQITPF
jgi:hypothetical protein